jgi:adenylate cyclase class IV
MHLNIEIKAKCSNLEHVRTILKSKNADYKGLDHQIDTYFKVPHGRLKLREGNIEHALIFYQRSNQAGPKDSNVILYTNQPKPGLKAALQAACGILVVVDKKREIYFIDNVKFHLDDVNNLGTYCEIEAIDSTGNLSREKLLEQCQDYMQLLGINDEDLVSCSYSDLILEKELN